MFAHVFDNGSKVVVDLTPTNHVVLRITNLARNFSLDITHTAWGQVILNQPVNKLRMAEDLAAIGQFFRGINNHVVSLTEQNQYTIACPNTRDFTSKSVALKGSRQECNAVRMLSCPQCGIGVTIPNIEHSRFAQGGMLKVPRWKEAENALAAAL